MLRTRNKRVSVTFVTDDDVFQHIIPAEEKKSGRAARRRVSYRAAGECEAGKRRRLWLPESDFQVVEDSSDEETPAPVHPHLSALTSQEENIAGQKVFSFRTPKKHGQMAIKVSESLGVSTPTPKSAGRGKGKATSGSRGKGKATPGRQSSAGSESSNHGSGRQRRPPHTTTPYRLNRRHAGGDSSDEDSVDDISDDDVDDEDDDDPGTDNSQGRGKGETTELTTNAEEYFAVHASGGVTSDRTLSRLDLGGLGLQELRDSLAASRASHPHHAKQCLRLCTSHSRLFRRWMLAMCNGFNILLYGLGSKRDLVEQFRSQYLSSFSHLVVNGYFPSLTIKQILTSITEDILDHEGSFRSPLDHVQFIRDHFLQHDNEDFYLLVHNIDGAMLRGEKTQNIFSLLAQISNVHLVASVDQINAPLMWDSARLSGLRWLWQDVTTLQHYTAETSYENSLLVRQSGGLALRSLAHVMRSLTPNARHIFHLLAQYQLLHSNSQQYQGMSFQDLYIRCREQFLVNSDQTLRAQLVEFRDHKLIRFKKSFDGVENLMIPIESPALNEFLEDDDK